MPDTMLDLDAELAAIETRRWQLREQRSQRAAELRTQLASLKERLRGLYTEVKPPDPNKVDAETQLAHGRYCETIRQALLFDTRQSAFFHRRRTLQECPFAEQAAEADRLRAEQRRTLAEYRAICSAAIDRFRSMADAANQRNAAAAAEVQQEIANLEAELLRLTCHESS